MLKLNALLRLKLAGVLLLTRGAGLALDQLLRLASITDLQTQQLLSSVLWRRGRRVRWSKSALHDVPALRRCLLSVCMAVLAFIHVAPCALVTLSTSDPVSPPLGLYVDASEHYCPPYRL